MTLPPDILSNHPGSFPWRVLAQRHPALIEQVRNALPYGPDQQTRLDDLLETTAHGVIGALPANAHNAAQWHTWASPYLGQSWFDVPFLVAENLFYRHLLEAVGYFAPGPWQWVDPFAPAKAAELQTVDVAELLAGQFGDGRVGAGQRSLLASVWGNQADLGFRVTEELDAAEAGPQAGLEGGLEAGLVADDSEKLWQRLNSASSARVVLVADNAGRELVADLLLIDHLLATGLAAEVALHVKPSPYFVSDAMTSDVVTCLRAIESSGAAGSSAADRLKVAAARGRLTVQTHWFYSAPLTFHDLPPELAAEFAGSAVVLLKGDLNYRRLTGDRRWDPVTDFTSVVDYFPGPLAALRTLKSDVVVGLTQPELDVLDATGQPWRTSGTYALIQARS